MGVKGEEQGDVKVIHDELKEVTEESWYETVTRWRIYEWWVVEKRMLDYRNGTRHILTHYGKNLNIYFTNADAAAVLVPI